MLCLLFAARFVGRWMPVTTISTLSIGRLSTITREQVFTCGPIASLSQLAPNSQLRVAQLDLLTLQLTGTQALFFNHCSSILSRPIGSNNSAWFARDSFSDTGLTLPANTVAGSG